MDAGATHRYLFPTLALAKTSKGGPVKRISVSENHRDYLAQLRSRKATALREKRTRAVRRYLWSSLGFDLCELEGKLKNCRWKAPTVSISNIRDESFETIRKALRKRRVSSFIPQYISEDASPRPTMQETEPPLLEDVWIPEHSSEDEESPSATLRIGYNGRISVDDLPQRRLLDDDWVRS